MTKRKKPSPISTDPDRKPIPRTIPEAAPQAFNDVSPLVEAQMRRAEKKIANLEGQVETLGKQKRVTVTAPKQEAPTIVLPPRPRIASVKIKYDALGMPAEMVPVYTEV